MDKTLTIIGLLIMIIEACMVEVKSKPQVVLDDQHDEFKWFDLSAIANDEKNSLGDNQT